MGRAGGYSNSAPMIGEPLLTRDEFREAVFARDHNRCVICGAAAADAHHIIERRLFPDGGYYLSNGVSLCDRGNRCHLKAEQTLISCEELREAAGITRLIIPSHLEEGERYTKWGDLIMNDGRRAPGELFHEEPVQKVLGEAGLLDLYTPFIKYPRTPHLSWSHGRSAADFEIADLKNFEGKEVIVTAKIDGENTTLTRERMYARSPDGNFHPSQAWARSLHGQIAWELPERWRFCGENLFAVHSIEYQNLPTYFFLFSVWNEKNEALSWDETEEWAELLGVKTVPILYRGTWDEDKVKACFPHEVWGNEPEGYVVRLAERFPYSSFRNSVAKFVRSNHVQTDQHWKSKAVVPNKLASYP
jgi:hypothetical protein